MANASERKTGLGPATAGLLRPTTPPETRTIPFEPDAGPDDAGDQAEAQGRGDASAESKAPTRARRKRPVVASKTTGRKLILPDDVHDRLWLLARQRRQSVSAVATEILDRNLPRFQVTREG